MDTQNLTADQAMTKLVDGNKKYAAQNAYHGDVSKERRAAAASGQLPYAIVLSCSDSRVVPEAIFSAGIGDIFIVRVAGNGVSEHVLASLEYAAHHLGAKLIVVLGHENCGAIAAAMAGGGSGRANEITGEIIKAIDGEKDALAASKKNALAVAKKVRQSMDAPKDVATVAAVYRMSDGAVEFLEEPKYGEGE